jgi:spore coat protein U-like protein
MKSHLARFLFPFLLAAAGAPALAQTCNFNANNLTTGTAYNPFSAAANDTSGLFTITGCNRPTGGQNRFPATISAGADNGGNFTTTRRLRRGATTSYLNYALFRNFGLCNQALGMVAGQVFTFNNSATGPNNTTTNPNPLTNGSTYCLRITALQNTAPPGTYTDTVTFGVGNLATGAVYGTDTVTFTTTILPACSFTTPPSNIVLNYTSFATVPSTATSNFQLRCTTTTTYTMALSATTGTALGLNYTLGLSAAAGTGSGVAQSYTINANMPAGQSGTCAGASCTATVGRTLTVTY